MFRSGRTRPRSSIQCAELTGSSRTANRECRMIGHLHHHIPHGGQARWPMPLHLSLIAALIAGLLAACGSATPVDTTASLYTNPLRVETTAAGPFESCADPAIIRGQQPGDHVLVHLLHGQPAQRRRSRRERPAQRSLHPDAPLTRPGELDLYGRRLRRPPGVVRRLHRPLGAGYPVLQRPVLPVLHRHRHAACRPGSAIGVATSPTPIGPVDGQRQPGRRVATRAGRRAGRGAGSSTRRS